MQQRAAMQGWAQGTGPDWAGAGEEDPAFAIFGSQLGRGDIPTWGDAMAPKQQQQPPLLHQQQVKRHKGGGLTAAAAGRPSIASPQGRGAEQQESQQDDGWRMGSVFDGIIPASKQQPRPGPAHITQPVAQARNALQQGTQAGRAAASLGFGGALARSSSSVGQRRPILDHHALQAEELEDLDDLV